MPARVALPARATVAAHVEDASTHMSVDVRLKDARDVAAEFADGYAVYPKAHASGATVLQRALPDGSEDLLSFDRRPESA